MAGIENICIDNYFRISFGIKNALLVFCTHRSKQFESQKKKKESIYFRGNSEGTSLIRWFLRPRRLNSAAFFVAVSSRKKFPRRTKKVLTTIALSNISNLITIQKCAHLYSNQRYDDLHYIHRMSLRSGGKKKCVMK